MDAALVAPGPVGRFLAVRTSLALVIGVRLALRRWWTAAEVPDSLYVPAFAVRWVPAVPPAGVLVLAQGIGLAAAGLVVARRSPRLAFATAWIALLVLGGFWSSTGKVMHNDLLLLLTSVPFLFARSPRPGEDPLHIAWGWPPRVALAVVGAIYAISGAQKVGHSGLAWITSDNMSWILWLGAQGTRSPQPDLARWVADHGAVARAMAGGALAVELSAPFLLARRRTRPAFVVIAAALHVGIWVTLGLDYYGWILTVAAVALAGRKHEDDRYPRWRT